METLKGKDGELLDGCCAPRKEGVVKQEEFLMCTEQLLHRGPQRGVAESGKARQSWNLEGKNRESCTPQCL